MTAVDSLVPAVKCVVMLHEAVEQQ